MVKRRPLDESLSKRIAKGAKAAAKTQVTPAMTPITSTNPYIQRKADSKLAMRDALCSGVEAEMLRAKLMAFSAVKRKIAGKTNDKKGSKTSDESTESAGEDAVEECSLALLPT